MRAILAGGGTGGHVIPALAIANQLKKSYDAECSSSVPRAASRTAWFPPLDFPCNWCASAR